MAPVDGGYFRSITSAPPETLHPTGIRHDSGFALFSALFSLIFVMTGGGPGYATTTMEFPHLRKPASIKVTLARPRSTA